jgi:hypothetical protein
MSKELLAQALEFLEDNQHLVADNERHAYVMEYNSFIEQLKEALAKQEQGEPNYKVTVIDNQHPNGVPLEQWGYTTPQQRTWVSLTDEEANELWESTDSDWELMKRVEAKLKEKNT